MTAKDRLHFLPKGYIVHRAPPDIRWMWAYVRTRHLICSITVLFSISISF